MPGGERRDCLIRTGLAALAPVLVLGALALTIQRMTGRPKCAPDVAFQTIGSSAEPYRRSPYWAVDNCTMAATTFMPYGEVEQIVLMEKGGVGITRDLMRALRMGAKRRARAWTNGTRIRVLRYPHHFRTGSGALMRVSVEMAVPRCQLPDFGTLKFKAF